MATKVLVRYPDPVLPDTPGSNGSAPDPDPVPSIWRIAGELENIR